MGPEKSSSSPIPLLRTYLQRLVHRSSADQLFHERDDSSENFDRENSLGGLHHFKKTGHTSGSQSADNLMRSRTTTLPTSSWSSLRNSQDSETRHPKKKWMIEPRHLKFQQLIGSGGSSHVYRGTYRGKQVAIKRFVQINQNYLVQELPFSTNFHHQKLFSLSEHSFLLP